MASIAKGENPRKPWTVKYRDAERKQRERSFAIKREAEDFKIKLEHDSRESIFVDSRLSKIIFTDYAAAWIARRRTAGTRASYASVLNAQILPVLGKRTLAQVAQDREAVQDLLGGMPGSASRKSSALAVIMGTIREAMAAGKISSHRLGDLKVEKDAQAPAVIIPAATAQLEKLAAGLRPELALTVWLMIGCGLRISEALAVRLDGFRDNGHGRTLCIHQQVDRDGKLAPLKARKLNENRDMPVPEWLWLKVLAHVEQFGTDDGHLFGSNGKRVTYGACHERFLSSVKRAALGELTEHGLRHLYVSILLSASVPITDVATWVGHRDIRITYAVYGHLLPDSWTFSRGLRPVA